MPIGLELLHGIAGRIDGEPFLVRRNGGPELRRKDRVIEVSGAVDLSLGYEHRQSVIASRATRSSWAALTVCCVAIGLMADPFRIDCAAPRSQSPTVILRRRIHAPSGCYPQRQP